MRMITKVIAIAAIKPDAYCTSKFVDGVEVVTYEDGVVPIDEALVDAKVRELQSIQDYQSIRRAEYPKIEEQLDQINHQKVGVGVKLEAKFLKHYLSSQMKL